MADWGQFGAGFLSGFAGTLESGLREKWRRDWYDERERRERGYKLADWEREKEWAEDQWEREKEWAEEQADVKWKQQLQLEAERERMADEKRVQELAWKQSEAMQKQRQTGELKDTQQAWYQSLPPEVQERLLAIPGKESTSFKFIPGTSRESRGKKEFTPQDALAFAAKQLGGSEGIVDEDDQRDVLALADWYYSKMSGKTSPWSWDLYGESVPAAADELTGQARSELWQPPERSTQAPTAAESFFDRVKGLFGGKKVPKEQELQIGYRVGEEEARARLGTTTNTFDYGRAMQIADTIPGATEGSWDTSYLTAETNKYFQQPETRQPDPVPGVLQDAQAEISRGRPVDGVLREIQASGALTEEQLRRVFAAFGRIIEGEMEGRSPLFSSDLQNLQPSEFEGWR